MEFIKFMSKAHLNNFNIGLYKEKDGSVRLILEDVISDKQFEKQYFKSASQAEEWYESLPGTGLGKLNNAIYILSGQQEVL